MVNNGRSNLVDIVADLLHETEKAFHIRVDKEDAWVPKSLVEHDIEDGRHTFTMPEWLAIERGLDHGIQ